VFSGSKGAPPPPPFFTTNLWQAPLDLESFFTRMLAQEGFHFNKKFLPRFPGTSPGLFNFATRCFAKVPMVSPSFRLWFLACSLVSSSLSSRKTQGNSVGPKLGTLVSLKTLRRIQMRLYSMPFWSSMLAPFRTCGSPYASANETVFTLGWLKISFLAGWVGYRTALVLLSMPLSRKVSPCRGFPLDGVNWDTAPDTFLRLSPTPDCGIKLFNQESSPQAVPPRSLREQTFFFGLGSSPPRG